MTKLQFKVCPDYLRDHTTVEDPVRIIITNPESIFITGILGESGRRMIQDGAPFIFTRILAEQLISNGVAKLEEVVKVEKSCEEKGYNIEGHAHTFSSDGGGCDTCGKTVSDLISEIEEANPSKVKPMFPEYVYYPKLEELLRPEEKVSFVNHDFLSQHDPFLGKYWI